MKATLSRLFDWMAGLWVTESDTEEERLCKAILTYAVFAIIGAATFWVVIYGVLGLWLSAAIPFAYQIASVLALLYSYKIRKFELFRFSHLLLILFLPFLLQWSLGGFAASSAVMLWAFWAPVGALMCQGIRQSLPWFGAYLALVLVSGVLDDYLLKSAAAIPYPLVVALFVMDVGAISTIVYFLLRYFALRRQAALEALNREHRLLQAEQERSERLLLNILPQPIAERLKRDPSVIADAFEEVTVLFADIVGFTPLTERIAPEAMVRWLNEVFSAFDQLADKYGLEKIRTIGDSYMVVGGVPLPRPDHAEAVAEMAIDMLGQVANFKTPDGEPLRVRIGINTGPAIAAVMGVRKFIYDVYGDAVNTASRMESQGVPGFIQVTETTYARLCDHYEFNARGVVQVKGKGEMTTYFLTGRRPRSLEEMAMPDFAH